MKKILRLTGLTASLLTIMLAASADAQTAYTAHVPFDFTVGKKTV